MAIRYSDLKKTNSTSADFISRRYDPTLMKLVVLFFIALGLGISLVSMLLKPFELVVVMTVLMGALGTYVIAHIQRSRDLVLATEFQNALFASSLSAGCRFSIIITREGTITYMDGGTQRMFSDLLKERQLTLVNMLKVAKLQTVEQDKIFDMVLRTTPDRLVCDIRGQDNRTHRVVITVEPIARPSGYVLIRARDYVEDRGTERAMKAGVNPLLSKSTIGMFAHVMDRMGMGIYLTDMDGNMVYANPVLEGWLGFGEGEITGGGFTMREVVHGISAVDAMNPRDFEGEHAMLRKAGGLIRAYINQKIVYGDGKKPLGCVAIISNIVESNTEVKKSLW
jgi:PAS domain S-box-containing protein